MSDRYEIRSKIAQGGVGAVYRGYDNELKRDVAIKRLLPPDESEIDSGDGEASKISFERETAALSSLQHPNIVSVFDAGVDEDGPFVIMELIDGETLDDAIAKGALDQEDFIQLSIQCLEALSVAQSINLLHRDVKPANIMVYWLPSGEFVAKILDFGLAKFSEKPALQTIDQGDSILGSIYFLAPEQFERLPLDPRTDVYSLGCVLYYSLTQKYPFTGESAAGVMDSHLNHRITPLEELREDLPPGLCRWVMRLSARMMNDRPSGASSALKELRTLIENNFVAPDDWAIKPAITDSPEPRQEKAPVAAPDQAPKPSPPSTATGSTKLITGAVPTKTTGSAKLITGVVPTKTTGSAKLITGVVPTVKTHETTGITTRRSSLTAPGNTTTVQALPRERRHIGLWVIIGLLTTAVLFLVVTRLGGKGKEATKPTQKETEEIPEVSSASVAPIAKEEPTPIAVPPVEQNGLVACFTAADGTEDRKETPVASNKAVQTWTSILPAGKNIRLNAGNDPTYPQVILGEQMESLLFKPGSALTMQVGSKQPNLFGDAGFTVALRIRRNSAKDEGQFLLALSPEDQSYFHGKIYSKKDRIEAEIKLPNSQSSNIIFRLPPYRWAVWVVSYDVANDKLLSQFHVENAQPKPLRTASLPPQKKCPPFNSLRIGSTPPDSQAAKNAVPFGGSISSLTIYDRPFDDEEIANLMVSLGSL